MWQQLAAYFALVGLRVLLNYRSLRNYLKLPLVEGRAENEPTAAWRLLTHPAAYIEPDALPKLVRFARERRAEALSIWLQQRCVGFWERVVVPFAAQQHFIGAPPERVNAGGERPVVASEHALLVEQGLTFDDRANLAKAAADLKAKGVRLLVVRAERLGTVEASRGGWGRVSPIGIGLSLLAIPCAFYGLATGSQAWEVAALVTYVTSVAELSLWQFLMGAPLSYAIYQPLAAAAVLAMLARKTR